MQLSSKRVHVESARAETRLRIGVFMGGRSIEREVSFNSGRTVCDYIDISRYHAIPIFQAQSGGLYLLPQKFLHRGKIVDFEDRLDAEATRIAWDELPELIDFAFIAMHGRYAEDGALQGMLKIQNIPFFGSDVLASALGMDKALQKRLLLHAGIRVPHAHVIERDELQTWLERGDNLSDGIITCIEALGWAQYPLIVKPSHEGSSCGVTLVRSREELQSACMRAATVTPGVVQSVIIEECIHGMEFSCIVIVNANTGLPEALTPTEIASVHESGIFDYEEKYMPGAGHKYTPARCTLNDQKRIQEACIQVMQVLGFSDFARIDGFLCADGSIVIIDPNSLGGMAPSSFTFLQAAQRGMGHTQLINHLLETALIRYGIIASHDALGGEHHMNMQKTSADARLRVCVLVGGPSAERQVSLESGRNVTYKLSPRRYEVIPVFMDANMHLYRLPHHLLVKNTTEEIAELVTDDLRIRWDALPELCDFVFIALHGRPGEDGTVQGALELLQLPYNGSGIAASGLCMDKLRTNQFLRAEGCAVPSGCLLTIDMWNAGVDLQALLDRSSIAFPVITKPHDDGCSVLVKKSSTIEELRAAVAEMFAEGRSVVLIEELVRGMELTVGVLGNESPRALPPSYSVAAGGLLSMEEKFLPGAGENRTPAPLPSAAIAFVQREIERAFSLLRCRGYARIDCFYQDASISPTGEQRLVILEVNTLPALTPATCIFHQAAEVGMTPMEFLDAIISYGLAGHSDCARAPEALSYKMGHQSPGSISLL